MSAEDPWAWRKNGAPYAPPPRSASPASETPGPGEVAAILTRCGADPEWAEHIATTLPSLLPGPGEGDLRAVLVEAVNRLVGLGEVTPLGAETLLDVLTAAVEQRTLAEKKVARVEALCDEAENPNYKGMAIRRTWDARVNVRDLRAALADPEAEHAEGAPTPPESTPTPEGEPPPTDHPRGDRGTSTP